MLIAVCLIAWPCDARDPKAVREFKRENPFPSTGKSHSKCSGWIVDHIVPLWAGDADHSANMQWQTVADSRVKDPELQPRRR